MFEVTKARTAVGLLIAAAVAAPSAGAMPTDHTPPAAVSAPGATDARDGYSFEAAPAPAPPAATRTVVVRSSGGFDWEDAGLGAAAMLSLLGLGAGAVVAARRSRPSIG